MALTKGSTICAHIAVRIHERTSRHPSQAQSINMKFDGKDG